MSQQSEPEAAVTVPLSLDELFPAPNDDEITEHRNRFRDFGRGSVRRARQHLDPAANLAHLSMMLASDAEDMAHAQDLPIPVTFIQARQRAASEILRRLSWALHGKVAPPQEAER